MLNGPDRVFIEKQWLFSPLPGVVIG